MARPLPVLRRSLSESWRSLIGWAVGIAAALLLYLPLFPSIGGDGQMQQIVESLPPELVKTFGFEAISSGPGYTQGTFFGLIGFLLFAIAGISWGAAAIGGAEESGRLELVLAHGVARVQYALEAALSIVVRLLLLGLLAAALVLALNEPSDLGIEAPDLLAATASLVGLALLSATGALAAGALTGRRVLGTGAGAAIAVIGYVANAIANQAPDAEWLRAISPYSWAYSGTPLTDGADWGGLALLWGASAVAVAVAAVALQRRDVTG